MVFAGIRAQIQEFQKVYYYFLHMRRKTLEAAASLFITFSRSFNLFQVVLFRISERPYATFVKAAVGMFWTC